MATVVKAESVKALGRNLCKNFKSIPTGVSINHLVFPDNLLDIIANMSFH